MIDEDRRALALEAFEFIAALSKSGDLERHGFESSVERLDRLVWTVAAEAVNLLQQELETLSVEQRGKTGIKKVNSMLERARVLGIKLEPRFGEPLPYVTSTRRFAPRGE